MIVAPVVIPAKYTIFAGMAFSVYQCYVEKSKAILAIFYIFAGTAFSEHHTDIEL
jgi:hypothetical protein